MAQALAVSGVQRIRHRGAGRVLVGVLCRSHGEEWTEWVDWEVLATWYQGLRGEKHEPPGGPGIPSSIQLISSSRARAALEAELNRVFRESPESLAKILGNVPKAKASRSSRGPVALLVELLVRAKCRTLHSFYSRTRATKFASLGSFIVAALLVFLSRSRRNTSFLFFGAGVAFLASSLLQKSAFTGMQGDLERLSRQTVEACRVRDAASEFVGDEEELAKNAIYNLKQFFDKQPKRNRAERDSIDSETYKREEKESVKAIDQQIENKQYEEAMAAVAAFEDRFPERATASFEILTLRAKAGYALSEVLKKDLGETDQQRLQVLENAHQASEQLVKAYPEEAISHKLYALLGQQMTEHLGMKEKIKGGLLFEKHTRLAIERDPNDPTSHYMLGRFQYSVANLTWSQRMAVKTIFGHEPPHATIKGALESFQSAAKLRPKGPLWIDLLEVARCQADLRNYKEARATMEKMFQDPQSPEKTSDAEEMDALYQAKDLYAQVAPSAEG